jgi:hypothetical protein
MDAAPQSKPGIPIPARPPLPTASLRTPPLPKTPRPRQRGRRIAASEVSSALDEIVDLLGLDQVYPLHRYIATQAGVHPTTVMRYHNSNLHTASARLAEVVSDVLHQVRDGEDLPIERPRPKRDTAFVRARGGRVPATWISERLDSIHEMLGKDETQFLYRYVGQHTGMHASSVRRYHRGELKSAPAALLAVLDELRTRLENGEAVAFLRNTEGRQMVDRGHTLEALERLLTMSDDMPKVKFFALLDEKLGLKPGTVNRIYYDRKIRFVRAEVHDNLDRLGRYTEYDPCRVFSLNERIEHHMFGVGVVREKIHKNKIKVEFEEGMRILAEAVPDDPMLRYGRAS